MNTILTVINRELANQHVRFVFPSQAASSAWAQKICGLTGTRSIALNRFLAWDRFKEAIIRAEVQDADLPVRKEPVSAVIRQLFAEALIRKNAEAARSGTAAYSNTTVRDRPPAALSAFTPEFDFDGPQAMLPDTPPGDMPTLPFRALIPPAFAEDGAVFASRIAGILPSLKLLKTRQEASVGEADDEDRDFAVLEREYTAFLDRHGLFEPSWERPPLRDREHDYYLFYPEAMEDFTEYEGVLRAEPNIHLVTLEDRREKTATPQILYRYSSSRQEIRAAALEIQRLHEEEGVPYEDMAISVPGLEEIEPYLLRELSLRNIPARRRSGRPLAEYGTGKLFSLVSACTASHFSFSAVKSLLLDERLPWRRAELNKQLIDFGVKNNCVSAYRDKNRTVDIWLEAFRGAPREERLKQYYEGLKTDLTAMTNARKFIDIRNHYFAFRGRVWEKSDDGTPGTKDSNPNSKTVDTALPGFLSRDNCSDEGDAVLARCVEELSALIQLEEDYPDLIPASPFTFFLSILKEKQYVTQQQNQGVNIFPYRVAAASPFTCHFVLNAAQDSATVLYRPLKFLRQDKRSRLGVTDTDASPVFFRLYQLDHYGDFKPTLRISSAEQTFSGWAIPHSFFSGAARTEGPMGSGQTMPAPPMPPDPFTGERLWWAAGAAAQEQSAKPAGTEIRGYPQNNAFPALLYPVQKLGFTNWQQGLCHPTETLSAGTAYSFLHSPFASETAIAQLLRNMIGERHQTGVDGKSGAQLRVSATQDLNVFYRCPAEWLYKRVFYLTNLDLEAKLLDDTSLGLLYHRILKDLFTRIRAEDGVFRAERLETYGSWIREITEADAQSHPAFQGPLAVPLVVSQAKAITQRLMGLLETEARYFSGYTVADLESAFNTVHADCYLNGIIDRVSVTADDAPVIIDYKTGATPTKKASSNTEDAPLEDFQMPMYIRLYEEKNNVTVGGAYFISINKQDITAVIGSPGRKKGFSREEYQTTLDAFDFYVEHFRDSVETLNFAPPEINFTACMGCDYRTICRTTYALNEGNHGN